LFSELKIKSWSEEFLNNTDLLNGARVILKTEDFGEIISTVWLPNFKTFNFSGLEMLVELAKLIGLLRLKKLRGNAN